MTKRKGIVVIALLMILGFGIGDSRFLWTGWVPDSGGLCLVSQSYSANSNSTYSIVFVGVNFTFLYWTYPPNITDLPYKAHFLIAFDDGTEENLSLFVGGYTVMMPVQVPRGVKTNHTFPSAGVITADTWGLWGRWQYTVNFLN